jgi:hypothetical protein
MTYQAKEVLNKVLNTSNDSLQVDIVDATGISITTTSDSVFVDDAAFTLGTSKGTMIMGFAGTQSVDADDAAALACDTDGALHIADGGNSITIDGTVTADLGATDNAVLDTIAASLAILDDWDDGNYANVNANIGGTDIVGGAGAVASGVQRVTLASDDPAVAKLGTIDADTGAIKTAVEIIDNAISGSEMQVDIVADGAGLATAAKQDILETTLTAIETDIAANEVLLGTIDADTGAIKTAVEIIDNAISGSEMQVDVVASLPAGSAAIGKLAANSGVDIGDVDVTSLPASTNTLEVVGDAAEDAAAAGNPLLAGGRYDDPSNDNSTVRSLDDNDVGALALDPTGALYVREHLGQAGSCFVSGTSAVTAAIGKFVAIQFLEDTVFNGTDGLVATDSGRWPDDTDAAVDISGSNTAAVGSQVFPQGMTIFGRWDSFKLVSGAVIAYVGNV